MSFLQGRVFRVLLGLAALSVPLAAWGTEQGGCIPREWAISVVDPNLADADSFGADTSIFVDDAGRPQIFYAKGPLNIDDWRIEVGDPAIGWVAHPKIAGGSWLAQTGRRGRSPGQVPSCLAHGGALWPGYPPLRAD